MRLRPEQSIDTGEGVGIGIGNGNGNGNGIGIGIGIGEAVEVGDSGALAAPTAIPRAGVPDQTIAVTSAK